MKNMNFGSRGRVLPRWIITGTLLTAMIMAVQATAQTVADNPYQVEYYWGELPGARPMGVVTGVQPDPDGEHIWVLERCGTNQCAGSQLDPIHKLDSEGNTV